MSGFGRIIISRRCRGSSPTQTSQTHWGPTCRGRWETWSSFFTPVLKCSPSHRQNSVNYCQYYVCTRKKKHLTWCSSYKHFYHHVSESPYTNTDYLYSCKSYVKASKEGLFEVFKKFLLFTEFSMTQCDLYSNM